MRSAVTLFADILRDVFEKELSEELPERVLPISTVPPVDLDALFAHEVDEIKKLLQPGRRQRTEAIGKLRALSLTDRALRGKRVQPTEGELGRLAKNIADGLKAEDLFPGVAAIQVTATGSGPAFDLRFTKKEGIPIQAVPEGTPGATVVGIKRVNELDFYNLSHRQLAEHLKLTPNVLNAIVWKSGLKEKEDCYKRFPPDKPIFGRYSQLAIERARNVLATQSADDVWNEYWADLRRRKKRLMKRP